MNRRRMLGASLAAAASCGRSRVKRPNILFILADDLSWAHANTRVFQRLAAEGTVFSHSFSACPSCTPSRSAVLTGRHIWQVGEAGVLYGTMPAGIPLFPHLLEDAGYWTGFTGKGWGPGDWKAGGLGRPPTGREYNALEHSPAVRAGIDKRDYAANFEAFLRERPRQAPFCFWMGVTEPHRIYAAGAGLAAGKRLADVRVPAFLPDTPEVRSDLLDYLSEVDWLDAQVARSLAVLSRTGEINDTLIIVTSDNGMPFPRAKTTLYDWGVRMPLVIRWGARVQGGRRVDEMVSHVDLAPTILDAAGLPAPPGISGRSLLPLLDGRQEAPRTHVFTALERHTICRPGGAGYPMRAIRTRERLYIRNYAPDRWPTGGPDFVSSNRTVHGDVDGAPVKDFMTDPVNQRRFAREYELCFGKRPAEELYDVAADPDQVRNLAGDPARAGEAARLRAALDSYLKQTSDPRAEGRDPWSSYPYRQTTGFGASFNTTLSEAEREAAGAAPAHKPE